MARASPGAGLARTNLAGHWRTPPIPPLSRAPVARPSSAYDDAVSQCHVRCGDHRAGGLRQHVGYAGDVPGMSCSEIGSFARQVAEHKAEGVSIDEGIRRLRQSFGSEHLDTEHELEK